MSAELVLHQFSGHACLAAHAYLRAAGLPYSIVNSRYPSYAATGDLPAITHGSVTVGGSTARVIKYLRNVIDLDEWLTEQQRADATALHALIAGPLGDVELAVTRTNLLSHTHGHGSGSAGVEMANPYLDDMTNSMLVPLRWIVPRTVRHAALRHLGRVVDVSVALREDALEAYAALDARLRASTGAYLFGQRPTSVDAALYGHLATVRHELPGVWVCTHTRTLTRFFAHMTAHVLLDPASPAAQDAVRRFLPSSAPLHAHPCVVREQGECVWERSQWQTDTHTLSAAATAAHKAARTHGAVSVQPQGPSLAAESLVPTSEGGEGSAAATSGVAHTHTHTLAQGAAHTRALTGMDTVSVPARRAEYLAQAGGADAVPTPSQDAEPAAAETQTHTHAHTRTHTQPDVAAALGDTFAFGFGARVQFANAAKAESDTRSRSIASLLLTLSVGVAALTLTHTYAAYARGARSTA